MHHATLLSPSDNKPILGWFKSILGTCTAASDNASRSGQQTRAAQATSSQQLTTDHQQPTPGHRLHYATSWPSRQLHRPENQQNQGKISGFPRENRSLLMTICPSIEKSIILLFRYCMHPVILLSYCIYPVILYKTTVILGKKMGFSICMCDPPLPKNLDPRFFLGYFGLFSVK
jgi:hypothetical protein